MREDETHLIRNSWSSSSLLFLAPSGWSSLFLLFFFFFFFFPLPSSFGGLSGAEVGSSAVSIEISPSKSFPTSRSKKVRYSSSSLSNSSFVFSLGIRKSSSSSCGSLLLLAWNAAIVSSRSWRCSSTCVSGCGSGDSESRSSAASRATWRSVTGLDCQTC